MKLTYADMKKLRDEKKAFKVEVQGITTHRKGEKVFVVLSVHVNGLASIRSGLKLDSYNPDQITHITIGES